MKAELAAAHAAVDDAVAILRDRRAKPHERIDKAAKDFVTDVDLASESALQRSLALATPHIGFYGEEGGGAPSTRRRLPPRWRAAGRLSRTDHERAPTSAALSLRRCGVGAVDACQRGQIQGMVLAHNNPYDVVAGHAIARAAGAICTDYAGAPLTLDSPGAMAAVPGIQTDLVSLAGDLAAPAARDD